MPLPQIALGAGVYRSRLSSSLPRPSGHLQIGDEKMSTTGLRHAAAGAMNSSTPEWEKNLPWHKWLSWDPFKIDALGLVTLLGAEEINSSIGRLVASRYLEYFPLLGAFVIANESFKAKLPSNNLYNLTDGINTSDLSFWFSRWLVEQEFEVTRSVVRFDVPATPRSWLKWYVVSVGLSVAFVGFLVAMTVLIGDWYGFANALAMTVSILARAYSMQVHRNAIDHAVEKGLRAARDDPTSPFNEDKKVLMILSDSKAVTLYLPGNLIIPVFSHDPEPRHSWLYHLIRYIGWVGFAVHIVTIGMATLLPQIYTVALMVIPTVLICWKLGCDDSKWRVKFDRRVLRRPARPSRYECWFGTRLRARVSEWPAHAEFEQTPGRGRWVRRSRDAGAMDPARRSRKRQDLYAWLNLSADEETSMGKWDLLPHVRGGNESWWRTYQAKKALIAEDPVDADTDDVDGDTDANGYLPFSSPTSSPSHQQQHQPPTKPKPNSNDLESSTSWSPDDSTVLTSSGNVVTSPISPVTETGAAFLRAGMMGLAHGGFDPGRFSPGLTRTQSERRNRNQDRSQDQDARSSSKR